MCGIAGICQIDATPLTPEAGQWVKAMTDRMAHRGPDGEGQWSHGPVCLGHRRLSIIDLSGGGQPMHSADGQLTVTFNGEIYNSAELKEQFPAYVNSLQLKDAAGRPLTLDAQGDGSFRDYLESFYMASAQQALDSGKDLSGLDWLTIQQGRVTGMDLAKYAVYVTRLKAVPAFDSFDLSSGETNEFGTTAIAAQHFTDFSMKNSTVSSTRADERIVRLLNPMNYIGQSGVTSAKYWRIRHGAKDRDTALAIPLLLATKLANSGMQVDFASPWDRGHDGDYDLSELFAWMDGICKAGR